ncbi:MAG: family 43 glycosylhydrolase [Parabacteroides sp.]
MRRNLLFIGACLLAWTVQAQQENYFTNPVIHGDVADPSILRDGSTYYATGTSSEWAPYYPIFRSSDLVNWQPIGHVFTEKPAWTKSSFWAPEWYQYNGKTYVYYTARKQADNISCIGVAVADSPEGPFVDKGPVVEFGKEAIDAFILEDQGKRYISWKAYGLDDRPIELLAARLSADGLRIEGEPFSLLRDDERQGMEGQHWFKKGEYYYLIYSVRGCCGPQSDYAVSVARSKRLEGPYEKYAGNPILHGSQSVLSIGHGTLTDTPDGRLYYLCHAYCPGQDFYQGRQPHLQELRIGEDLWPHFVTGEYASLSQPMPFTETAQKPVADFCDHFEAPELRTEWSWNYPYCTVQTRIRQGQLALWGTPIHASKAGAALCLRPTSANYRLESVVLNQNDSWKGITLYGDDQNWISLGCVADQVAIRICLDGKEQQLAAQPMPSPVTYLRMEVTEGTKSRFFISRDGTAWQEVALQLSEETARSLVRWDRISRPGLYQSGSQEARFGYVKMERIE